jgi:hypothetical protein
MKRITVNIAHSATMACIHQVAGLGEAPPGIEAPGHPQAGEAGERHRPAGLSAEAALDRLEQREALLGLGGIASPSAGSRA